MLTRERSPRHMLLALTAAVVAGWTAGCVTDRLEPAAPSGVDLSGEWKLNLNLSDDPDKLLEKQKTQPSTPGSGGRRSHGRAGPGGAEGPTGMPPIGSPYGSQWRSDGGAHFSGAGSARQNCCRDTLSSSPREAALSGDWSVPPDGLLAAGFEQPAPPPPTGNGAGASSAPNASNAPGLSDGPARSSAPAGHAPSSRAITLSQLLQAPTYLSIAQKGAKVLIRTNMPDGTRTSDEYAAGTRSTIPIAGDNSADRSAGWRGPVFVVTTKTKKGWREDDYALDEDGRLIVTTDMRARRLGKFELKRVYDRMKR